MTSKLKWARATLRGVIQDGEKKSYGHSDRSKGSSVYTRSPRDKNSSSRFDEKRRVADNSRKHLQNGSASVASLVDRVHQGVAVDSRYYVEVLKGCFKQNDLQSVRQVHDCAKKSGLEQNRFVGNSLLKGYIGCGRMKDAHELFDRLQKKDTVSWTTMIGGYAEHDQAEDAVEFYQQMVNKGGHPNAVTYLNVLKACASPTALKWGKKIHAHIKRGGFEADVRVCNALVHMYANCGSIDDARIVFRKMKKRNVISWTAMIGGLAEHSFGHEAFSLFLQMQKEGFTPNPLTYVSVLNPSSSAGASEWVKEVHTHAMEAGLDVNLRVGNALVHMYAKSGSISDARQVFDKMVERNVFSWTSMIGGLAQHGHAQEALKLYDEMKFTGVKPNGPLFVAVLAASSHGGLVEEGRFHIVSMTRDYGIQPALEHCNCVVDTLGRAGHLEEAKLFILNMSIEPNEITWKALLGSCRIYNAVKLAELAAEECLKLKPMDPSPYVLLSNIYGAVGSREQVSWIRSMMQERGIRKDPGLCWIEVDNKIHHFVAGDTSHPEAREIYDVLSSLYEKLKTEGYVPDTRLVFRNIHEEDKRSALLSHGEKLAIAYGLMQVASGKPIRIYQNIRMCSDCHTATKLISKVTRREIFARDVKRFHHFKDGVCSCGDYW